MGQQISFLNALLNHYGAMLHFLRIVADNKASGSPHVLKLWLGVSNNMIPAKKLLLFTSVEFYIDNDNRTGISGK